MHSARAIYKMNVQYINTATNIEPKYIHNAWGHLMQTTNIQLLESPCSSVRWLVRNEIGPYFQWEEQQQQQQEGIHLTSSSSEQTLLTQLGLRTYTIHLDTCITLWIHASCIHASCIQASYIHAYIRVHASELHGHICVGHTP